MITAFVGLGLGAMCEWQGGGSRALATAAGGGSWRVGREAWEGSQVWEGADVTVGRCGKEHSLNVR